MTKMEKKSAPPDAAERRLTYAEALLLEAVLAESPRGGRVLVAGNRSGVVVAEAMRAWPEAAVCAHAFDAHHARALRDRLAEDGLPVEGVLNAPGVLPEGAAAYDSALFMTTPQSMPAELVLDQLQDIYQSLAEGVRLPAQIHTEALATEQRRILRPCHRTWREREPSEKIPGIFRIGSTGKDIPLC